MQGTFHGCAHPRIPDATHARLDFFPVQSFQFRLRQISADATPIHGGEISQIEKRLLRGGDEAVDPRVISVTAEKFGFDIMQNYSSTGHFDFAWTPERNRELCLRNLLNASMQPQSGPTGEVGNVRIGRGGNLGT